MFGKKKCYEILSMLKRQKAKRVLIQVPDGLKMNVQELSDFLENNGIGPLISVEPCFGACDLRDREAKMLGCDLLLHIGHADLKINTVVPVVYYEYPLDYDFIPLIRANLKRIKFRKICLVSTVQFRECLKGAKAYLEKNGFEVYDGGFVLGCNVSGARKFEKKTECYLFIGSGRFHPLGLQEKTGKPVLFLDIEKRSLEDLSKERNKMEIRRKLALEKASQLKNFGVLLSMKPGQASMRQADETRRKLQKAGKNAYVLVGDCFTPEKLLGLKIDAFVNTACPRIRDDAKLFRKVILNAEDIDELLAKNKN